MIEIKLKQIKKTPGTIVYGQVSSAGSILPKENALIPALYIKKEAFEGSLPPTTIKVVYDHE